jgi:GNAT superfamily N-acetyltransferase
MDNGIVIRRAVADDAYGISSAIRDAFLTNVGPVNPDAGTLFFVTVQNPKYYKKKIPECISMFVAEKDNIIVGVIGIKGGLAPFFIIPDFQRQGIGKKLFSIALRDWVEKTNNTILTLKSSPNAIDFYKKLGFDSNGEEYIENDIRCIPMQAQVSHLLSINKI